MTGLWKIAGFAVGASMLASCLAFGQSAPAKLAFEVASIRPSAPLDPGKMQAAMQAGKLPRFGTRIDASRAEYNYMSLKELIANAYGVKLYQVTGPDWLVSRRFDIAATMPEGSSRDDAPKMLQSLLAERFKVEAHRDTQEHPVLGLVVGKGGPKMKESTGTPEPFDEDAPLKPGEMTMDTPEGPARISRNPDGSSTINLGAKGIITQRMDAQTQTLHLESTMVTMDGFAEMLTNLMQMGGSGGKQVVDMTDLKGNYQVAIDVSLADLMAMMRAQGMNMPGGGGAGAGSGPAVASEPNGGSTVFESVQKLGLKLEPRKANVTQVVVDHAEKTPTEN